ncbi:MAG: hypothetical protein NZ455_11700 [Bacteroidia bacterium]|nr:hypothetical protein [Bacteroidia bacterium]MDW8347593.1 hypothetical protein [Bacteroidia bacterium]
MRRACVSTVRSTEAIAQPAARRPERSEGHAQKTNSFLQNYYTQRKSCTVFVIE